MFHHALDFGLGGDLVDVMLDRGALFRRGNDIDQLMLGCQHHEGRAPERIRAGGINLDGVFPDGGIEGRARAFAATDPVGLHDFDGIGPIHASEAQQLIGVFCDSEEPLLHHLVHDWLPGALVLAIDDLLVCQHGLH